MPSARTPDPAPAGSSRRSATSPSPAGKAGPPSASPLARAPTPVPAFGGLRLIEVPGGWPPYDCEIHGTACPAAREVSVPSPCAQWERGAPEGADPPGPSLTFSAGRPADGPADPVVAWSRQFAQVIVEILAGARSPRQLAPWTTERVRDRTGSAS